MGREVLDSVVVMGTTGISDTHAASLRASFNSDA